MIESYVDWTRNKEGKSNSSEKFLELSKHVESLIRNEAAMLISGRADMTAGLIVANLAHAHHFGPRQELEILLRKAHDKMDDANSSGSNDNWGIGGELGCLFCDEYGYDGNGMKHKDDCILVLIRKELS